MSISPADKHLIKLCEDCIEKKVFDQLTLQGFNAKLAQVYRENPGIATFTSSDIKNNTIYLDVSKKLRDLLSKNLIEKRLPPGGVVKTRFNYYSLPFDKQLKVVMSAINLAKKGYYKKL